jgi:hypothetical protein
LYPEHLRVALYKKEVLDECKTRFTGNDSVIGEQTLSSIVNAIKNANTVEAIDAAKQQIEAEKTRFLNRIGL